jgi:tRNA(fMet)-specific endonuclease VapC
MYLLDTDIVICALKGVPEVLRNFEQHRDDRMAISVITYGELVFGAEKSARRTENLARVAKTAELYPVITVSRPVMDTFGRLKEELARRGKPIDDFDLLIAATTLTEGCYLVTGNTDHFSRIPNLRIENWTIPQAR